MEMLLEMTQFLLLKKDKYWVGESKYKKWGKIKKMKNRNRKK